VVWLHHDLVVQRLDAEIDNECDDQASLSVEARQAREAEALADLLDIERQEASMVWAGQAQGMSCEHRADCSPMAVLQCKLVQSPPTNGGGSSWMHAFDVLGSVGRR